MIPTIRSLHTLGLVISLACLMGACTTSPSGTEPVPAPATVEQANTAHALATPAAISFPTAAGAVSSTSTPSIVEKAMVAHPAAPDQKDPTLGTLVAQAKADLASRLSIRVDQIGLLEAKPVEWPDASLGCPQQGTLYAQVITPGYLVVLEAREKLYEYHTSQDQVLMLCEKIVWSGNPPQGFDSTVDDGWPNQPRGDDVIIAPPSERKRP